MTTKRNSKSLWTIFVHTCTKHQYISRRARESLAGVAGVASFVLMILVFTRSHRETLIQWNQSEAKTRAIQAMLDSEDFGYAILSQDGSIIEWNPAMARLTNWDQKEVHEKGLAAVFSPEILDSIVNAMGTKSPKGTVLVFECKVRKEGHPIIPVRFTGRVVEDPKTKLKYMNVHCDKMSSIKQMTSIGSPTLPL